MSGGRIDGYVAELARALRARGAYSRDLVDEVRDHLLDGAEAAQRGGMTGDAAEADAVARIGAVETIARHAAADVAYVRRRLLLGSCAATVGAIAFLSLSLLVLRPPRAHYGNWCVEAGAVLGLTTLTFAWVKTGALASWIRPVLVVGSIGLALAGGLACYGAATGDFEGYGVVLGALFTVQAALALVHLVRPWRMPVPR